MAYKYLNRSAVLEHLQEGQTVNIDEYIEKLRFFKKYTDSRDYFNFGVKTMGGKHRTIETRRGVSVQTPFLVLPIIRPLYASNQDPGKL